MTFRLNHIGQQILKGHRLRLSRSTSYWPLAWPSPEPVCLTVHCAGNRLEVPVRRAPQAWHERPRFGAPQIAKPKPKLMIQPDQHDWIVHRYLGSDASELELIDEQGVYAHEYPGLEVGCMRASGIVLPIPRTILSEARPAGPERSRAKAGISVSKPAP